MQSEKIAELLHQYFELGVAEGREGRNHDTEAGDAQRVLSEIEAEIAAFSAAEPIGFLIPRGDVAGPDNEYYSFCEDQGSAAAEADIYDKGYFPIYAAPPALTAQVQDVAGLERLRDVTYAVQHNPNCSAEYLVRLVGKSGSIDFKNYGQAFSMVKHETGDILGFGKTLDEAIDNALAAAAPAKQER